MGDDTAQEGLSLIGRLGISNPRPRKKALRIVLESWLPSQPNLTDDMMNELWNNLFYCVWHVAGDSLRSRDLIDRLSSLLPRLHNSSLSLHYFSSFLLTVRQEWCAVTAPGLDTFYLLIRRFLHYSFAFLKIHSWNMELTSRLISILEDACFLVREGKFEVSYHIASVFLEELRPFLPLQPEVLEVVFKPFISVMGSLPDKVLLGKIKSNMFDVLLKMGNKLLEVKKLGDEVNDDAVVLGTIALTIGFSSKFFELGYSVDCCQGNKKVLFVLYSQFLKLEKDLEFSGIQVSIPQRVPTLIPVGTDMEVGGLDKPLKRKNKKKASKKRQRAKSMNGQNPELNIEGDAEGGTLDEVGHNIKETVVALKIVLSNGEHRKWTIGSGAVISKDGLVLTCAHLLHDYEKPEYNLKVAEVVFFNRQTYEAEVIIKDVGKDLALLKIHAHHHYGELKLSHASLAMPQEIETGMNAYLISNPYYFSFLLSAITVRYEKKLYKDMEFGDVLKLDHDTVIIQTDNVSEAGNFGGPLFNSNGEIMGVQFANTDTFKFGIHVESILNFLEKNNVMIKEH